MKKIGKSIIIILLIVIVLTISIIFLLKTNNSSDIDNDEEIEENIDITNTINKTFRKIDNYSMYFTVKNILNNYVKYFEYINNDVEIDMGTLEITEQEAREEQYKQGMQAVYYLFDKEYQTEASMNIEKIKQIVQKYKNNNTNVEYPVKIDEMYIADINTNMNLVLVYSKINNIAFNCMIKIDTDNQRYTMYWEDYMNKNKYTKERTEEITIKQDNIEENNYSTFAYVDSSNEYVVTQYFSDLKKLMMNDSKQLYEILDKEYKEKRFPKYEKLVQYTEAIQDEIEEFEVSKYKYEQDQIQIIDNYNNYYIFKIADMINYTVLLDDYTLENEEIKNNYLQSDDDEKVYANIDKWIKMINQKDYENAYNLLAQSFRNNKYPNIEEFKKYINQNLYDYSKVQRVTNFEKSGDYYIAEIELKDIIDEDAEEKTMTIIMQLLEEENFVMSFSN